MESSVLLSTRQSCRCKICWPGCAPRPQGAAGDDLMVIWFPAPPLCSFSLTVRRFSCFFPFSCPLFSLFERHDKNSHNDIIRMSQQVGVTPSGWVGLFSSWQIRKQFHVTGAESHHICVSLSSGQHILIWLTLSQRDVTVFVTLLYTLVFVWC